MLQHMAYDRIRVPDFMFIVSDKRFWAGNLGFMSVKDLKQLAKMQVRLETDGESASADDR